MNKAKFLVVIGLVLFLFFFPFNSVWAADLEVTCTFGSCSSIGDKPLFSETNILPGWSKTKTVKAINNYGQEMLFATKLTNLVSSGGLSDVLTISIKKSGEATNIYQDNLTNFKNYGYLVLSTITGLSQEYDFTVKMQNSAGNEYQGLNSLFDLNLGFEALPAPTATPTSAPGPTVTPTPGVCAATTPSAPTNLTATAISSSVISLSWTAPPETITHYSIVYGLSSGSYLYGNNNVGSVTSYVVSELSSGTTYYFVVYAVNDCAVSSASNEASATTSGILGVFVAAGPAPGFEEALGEETEEEAEAEVLPGEVAGTEIMPVCFWWWILALLEAVLVATYYRWLYKNKKKFSLYVPILLAVLAYVSDQFIAHRFYTPSRFCGLMWLWSILGSAIPAGFYFYLKKKA